MKQSLKKAEAHEEALELLRWLDEALRKLQLLEKSHVNRALDLVEIAIRQDMRRRKRHDTLV